MTSTHEYHYKGHEPYVQLLHTVYTRFDTLPLPLYILLPELTSVGRTLILLVHISHCRCCHVPLFQLQTCTRPFFILLVPPSVSAEFCPSSPKLNYSTASQAEPRGLLEGENIYIAEQLLRIADTIGERAFFRQFQAGFTLAEGDPPYSVCSCNQTQDCANISPLNL